MVLFLVNWGAVSAEFNAVDVIRPLTSVSLGTSGDKNQCPVSTLTYSHFSHSVLLRIRRPLSDPLCYSGLKKY